MASHNQSSNVLCDHCRLQNAECPVELRCKIPDTFFGYFKHAFRDELRDANHAGDLWVFAHSVLDCLLKSFMIPLKAQDGFVTTSDIYVMMIKAFSKALVSSGVPQARDGRKLRRFQLTAMLPEEFYNGPQQSTLIVPAEVGKPDRHCRLIRRAWQTDSQFALEADSEPPSKNENGYGMGGAYWKGSDKLRLERLIIVRDHKGHAGKAGILNLWNDIELLAQSDLLIADELRERPFGEILLDRDAGDKTAIIRRILADDLGSVPKTAKLLGDKLPKILRDLGGLTDETKVRGVVEAVQAVIVGKVEGRLSQFDTALRQLHLPAYAIMDGKSSQLPREGWEQLISRFCKDHCGNPHFGNTKYLVLTGKALEHLQEENRDAHSIADAFRRGKMPEITLFGYDDEQADITSASTEWICGVFAYYEQFTREMLIHFLSSSQCEAIHIELGGYIRESQEKELKNERNLSLKKFGPLLGLLRAPVESDRGKKSERGADKPPSIEIRVKVLRRFFQSNPELFFAISELATVVAKAENLQKLSDNTFRPALKQLVEDGEVEMKPKSGQNVRYKLRPPLK